MITSDDAINTIAAQAVKILRLENAVEVLMEQKKQLEEKIEKPKKKTKE